MIEFQITKVDPDDTVSIDFLHFEWWEFGKYFREYLGLTPCYDVNAPAGSINRKDIVFVGENNGSRIIAQLM